MEATNKGPCMCNTHRGQRSVVIIFIAVAIIIVARSITTIGTQELVLSGCSSPLLLWQEAFPFCSHRLAKAPVLGYPFSAHHCTDQVMDGERGNEYRKQLLPTYKSNRNAFVPLSNSTHRETWKGDDADLREALPLIMSFMKTCGIPVVRLEDAEADDVVASLTEQAVHKGFRVSIASPDKDFKQLLCKNVQLLVPVTDLHRWSFYTEKLYIAQHGCNPEIELSLRCLLGDKVDCIPGLAEFAPGFGRKTALKLLKKHGSLERLLHEASKRTVGKPFVQDALSQHAPVLWRNLEVLRLRRDIPIHLVEDWCVPRESTNDEIAFSELERQLKALSIQRAQKDGLRTRSIAKRLVVRSFSDS